MRRVRVLVLAVALVLTPGCTDLVDDGEDPQPDGGDDDQPYTYEDCTSAKVSGNRSNTTLNVARIQCDANVPGVNRQTMPCERPADAELNAGANLTRGQVRVLVRDDANSTIADHTLQNTSKQGRQLDVSGGEAGEWTLVTQREEEFTGKFAVELSCPVE